MALEYEELTERIIGAAIEVHRTLGPGFLESIYENALVLELKKRGLSVQQELEIPIHYLDVEVGKHRLDQLVEKTIVVEIKAIKVVDKVHFAIARSYLKAMSLRHGLILNFSSTTLQPKTGHDERRLAGMIAKETRNPGRMRLRRAERDAGDYESRLRRGGYRFCNRDLRNHGNHRFLSAEKSQRFVTDQHFCVWYLCCPDRRYDCSAQSLGVGR